MLGNGNPGGCGGGVLGWFFGRNPAPPPPWRWLCAGPWAPAQTCRPQPCCCHGAPLVTGSGAAGQRSAGHSWAHCSPKARPETLGVGSTGWGRAALASVTAVVPIAAALPWHPADTTWGLGEHYCTSQAGSWHRALDSGPSGPCPPSYRWHQALWCEMPAVPCSCTGAVQAGMPSPCPPVISPVSSACSLPDRAASPSPS